MKQFFKAIVVAILSKQVRLLRKKHHFLIVGVVGGIGKTSTKLAVAQLLGASLRVRYQEGNYNDIVSVPLIFFGHSLPSLNNPLAWFRVFMDNIRQIAGDYPYDVVVVELGTDRLGQIAAFQQYLSLDYAIITAIVPEHMEYLHDMKSVADEELAVKGYAEKLIYNGDLVAAEYRMSLQGAVVYGKRQAADFRLGNIVASTKGFECDVIHNHAVFLHFDYEAISEVQLYSVLAAITVGHELGLNSRQLLDGVAAIRPVSGRLRRLRGINNSFIIDDTYNALPDAVKPGLTMLYGLESPQKIAILGNMNQFGALSAQAHTEIGELCDPAELNLVVTIGVDANKYLAPAAAAKGCTVRSFTTPYEAGDYLKPKIEPGAIIFAKGSQDGVFTEEAIKPLLADPNDASKLVRQSAHWMKRKQTAFGRVAQL